MSYSYQLSKEAEEDIIDSYDWYESKRKNLGEEFLICLERAKHSIKRNPHAYQIRFKKRIRAYVLDRFPYLVLYVVKESSIDVISVFNTNQDPYEFLNR